jgi:uncharacterized membrane protein
MLPTYQNSSAASPSFHYQPVQISPDGRLYHIQSPQYIAHFPLEQNRLACEAKKSVDFWNSVLKVSSFLVLLPLTFLVCMSLVQDPDTFEPVVALLFLPGIAVCLKGISTANHSDVGLARRYLQCMTVYVGMWVVIEAVLLFLLGAAFVIDDSADDKNAIDRTTDDLVGISIVWIATCLTLMVSSLFIFIACKVYRSRQLLETAAKTPGVV